MDVLIVHYNTPRLTSAAIRSLLKHTADARVTVFDNSDKAPFPVSDFDVDYIDNTHGQVIDWERWLSDYPSKLTTYNNWGSAKHCQSIELCLGRFPDGVVLMDSDVLVLRDITPLIDDRYAWVGQLRPGYRTKQPGPFRVEPFLCYINTGLMRQHGIHYCDPGRIVHLTNKEPGRYYDTGASFWEDCTNAGLAGCNIPLEEYIIHLGSGSWKDRPAEAWLNEHLELWA